MKTILAQACCVGDVSLSGWSFAKVVGGVYGARPCVLGYAVDMTPVELQRFLMTLVQDDKLEMADGEFKLKA